MGRWDVTAATRNAQVIVAGHCVAPAELMQDLTVLTHW
jgi:hypothetical protein